MSNSTIWPIDRILSDATTPGQSGPDSDGNEGLPRILQRSSITVVSLSDCLVSYFVTPADWASYVCNMFLIVRDRFGFIFPIVRHISQRPTSQTANAKPYPPILHF